MIILTKLFNSYWISANLGYKVKLKQWPLREEERIFEQWFQISEKIHEDAQRDHMV